MKESDILEVEIIKEINCSKEVALWNYWDHEHRCCSRRIQKIRYFI